MVDDNVVEVQDVSVAESDMQSRCVKVATTSIYECMSALERATFGAGKKSAHATLQPSLLDLWSQIPRKLHPRDVRRFHVSGECELRGGGTLSEAVDLQTYAPDPSEVGGRWHCAE